MKSDRKKKQIFKGIKSIVQTIEKCEELCIWMCLSFFLFSTKKSGTTKINGLGWMIYHIKDLSIVIRTKIFIVSRNF